MNRGWRRWPSVWASAVFVLAVVAPARAQLAVEESPRDRWQRVEDVVEALGVGSGSHVADVGAGSGYFTLRLANVVGETGRVYAVDIDESELARLRGRLDRAGVRHVDVILSEVSDPHLPYRSLDAILVVNAYHEFEEHRPMLAAFRGALRPGGRLVLLDNPPSDPTASRRAQMNAHVLDIEIAAADLREAGFEVLHADPGFIDQGSDRGRPRMWLLQARRPLRDPPVGRLRGAPPTPEGLLACGFPGSKEELRGRASPPDSTELFLPGAGRVKVCYSRPSARGRTIMGGLVPYDEPWRTGADEATVLRAEVPVRIAGIALEPGWYSLYTVPGRSSWQVVLNRLVNRLGAPIDDWVRSHDVGAAELPVTATEEHVETFTIRGEIRGPGGGELILEWERTRLRVPVEGTRKVDAAPHFRVQFPAYEPRRAAQAPGGQDSRVQA